MLLARTEGSRERLARRGRRVWPPTRGDVPSFGNLIHKDLAKSRLAVSERRNAMGEGGDVTRRDDVGSNLLLWCQSEGFLYHNSKELLK